MKDFTEKQIELLYEMTDLHFQWFSKYNQEVKYEEVLKLNHEKMISILESCQDYSEDMIDFIFQSIIRDYRLMIEDYDNE
jgi:hypothetical protein